MSDAPAAPTSALTENPVDVIIVGGGVIGCWTAHYLIERGVRVRIVERDTIGSGASFGNCGFISPSHVMPLCIPGAVSHTVPQILTGRGAVSMAMRVDPTLWKWMFQFSRQCYEKPKTRAAIARHEMLRTSIALYRDLVGHHGLDCQWQDAGLMLVHRGQRTFDNFQKTADELASQYDVHAIRLDRDRLLDQEPALRDNVAGGWFFAGDAHTHPGQLMKWLHNHLKAVGCEIVEGTEVTGLDVADGKITGLSTPQGTMRAKQYLIASGAESPRFAKPLGCTIPIIPGKGFSMTFSNVDAAPRVPMIFEDSHVAVTPWKDQLRVGSTMRFAGFDRSIHARRIQRMRDDAQSYLHTPLPQRPESPWAGWRPMVYDGMPCIDRTPKVANAYVAAGHGMVGISSGTGTGKLIAQMMTGETPHIDPAPYSLKRF